MAYPRPPTVIGNRICLLIRGVRDIRDFATLRRADCRSPVAVERAEYDRREVLIWEVQVAKPTGTEAIPKGQISSPHSGRWISSAL